MIKYQQAYNDTNQLLEEVNTINDRLKWHDLV